MHISSSDSNHLFSANTYTDFTIQTPSHISLPVHNRDFDFLPQQWSVALVDFALYNADGLKLQTSPSDFVLLCSLCAPSYIKGRDAPVIRIFALDGNAALTVSDNSTHYINVKSSAHTFNQFRIYIRDLELNPVDSTKWIPGLKISLTLHFIRE